MEKKNILITGATGYLGKNLIKHLKLNPLYNILDFNSLNFNKIWDVPENSVELIIHAAVKTEAGSYCRESPGEQFLINSDINNTVLKYWKEESPKAHFITFGSSCAYGPSLLKIEENYLKGECEPGYEVYGNIKRNLLVGLKALNQQYGMTYSYLIPTTFYGPNYDLNDKHFIFDLIRKIHGFKAGKYDEIELWGDGTQTRELMYIDDAIRIIMQIIDSPSKYPSIMNLSNGEEWSLKNYSRLICQLLEVDAEVIKWDINKFVGAKSKNLVNTHLKNIPFTPLSVGIKNTIKYYENS